MPSSRRTPPAALAPWAEPTPAASEAHAAQRAGRTRSRVLRCAIALGTLFAVVGCGGGGGATSAAASGDGAAATDFPVADTFQRLWTTDGSWRVSHTPATPPGAPPFEVTVTYTRGADEPFEGSMRRTVTQLATYRVRGVVTGVDITKLHFSTAGGLQLWGSSVLGGPYTVMDPGATTLPARRATGLEGAIGSSRVYADVAKTVQQASGRHGWAVERVDDATARVCLNTTQTDTASPGAVSTESTCWRVGRDGEVLGLRLTVTTGGQTVTFE